MKMTGWQTRLTFPVIPKEQWEFPTVPSEPQNDDSPPEKRLRLDDENSATNNDTAKKLRRKRRKAVHTTTGSRTPNVGVRESNKQDEAPIVAAAIPQANQYKDEELVYIKSEEIVETMPTILPDPDDQNFYCRACQLQKSSRATYRYHLKYFHKMQITSLQPPRFTTSATTVVELPNLYDPLLYCRICEKKYKDVATYRRHCTNHHGMQLLRPQIIPDPNITPDPNDPMNYCKACNRSYEMRSTYRDHLRRVHKMPLVPVCTPANLDRSKGFVCRFCTETFEEGKAYGAHLQANHQGKLEKR